jgi:hypothetical protein
MSISASAERDAAGRFLPGHSGNPAGKVPGTRNRATRLRQLLADGEDRIIGRVLIDKAKAGDAVAARFVIGHLMPRPRGRAIELDLPEGAWAGDIVALFNATMLAMASGEITPDEALTITRSFDGRLKALKAYETERYLTRWEGIPGDTAFEAPEEDEELEEEARAPAAAPIEPSPRGPFDKCSGRQGEGGAVPANALHPGEHPHPGPLPRGEGAKIGEREDQAPPSDAPAAAPIEPSPLGPFNKCSGGLGEDGAVRANSLHSGESPHPDPLPGGETREEALTPAPPEAPAPLPPACIQPSPATIAGRRRVAEQALRQWARTLPG